MELSSYYPTFFGSIVSDSYTISEVSGKTIEKSLGLVQYTETGMRIDIMKKINSIFQSLLQIAREKDANAVINVKITAGSYMKNLNDYVVTYIMAYGEAVILK